MKMPSDDIAFMRRLMEESQSAVREDGRHLIAWGLLLAIGQCLTYWSASSQTAPSIGSVWAAVLGAGWIFSIWIGARQGREARVRTLGGRLVTGLWVGTGIALTLLGVLAMTGSAFPTGAMNGVSAIVCGSTFFAGSFLLGGWLRWLAVAWWVGGGTMLMWPSEQALLLMAAMLLGLLVAPGIVLFWQARSADARHETTLAV